jgi:hypothetical protein
MVSALVSLFLTAPDIVLMQGPLLDFGRNPILFPCAWVYRQGVLTPWARGRYLIISNVLRLVIFKNSYVKGSHL